LFIIFKGLLHPIAKYNFIMKVIKRKTNKHKKLLFKKNFKIVIK
jgi:hypothetical protein